MNPGARVYALPLIAGHVGADTAGVILSEAPHDQEIVNLIVDVGTNAEIVLGNRDRLLAASSPTGPAFEGAQISCGQRAAPGAIERVRIDPETLELRYRTIGSEVWSDEPGAPTPTGVCGSGIIELVAELYLAGILTGEGVIDPAAADRTDRVIADGRTSAYVVHAEAPRLILTQNDVRQIQLAKGALYAGCRLLMDHYGIEQVDRIRLAGAFGAHIDPVHAMVLGLVPDCDPANVTSAGNAAGTGARIALLNRAAATRSKRSCAASTRSRPPPSRGSRSISSGRWASRTRPIRIRGSPSTSGCPSARPRATGRRRRATRERSAT